MEPFKTVSTWRLLTDQALGRVFWSHTILPLHCTTTCIKPQATLGFQVWHRIAIIPSMLASPPKMHTPPVRSVLDVHTAQCVKHPQTIVTSIETQLPSSASSSPWMPIPTRLHPSVTTVTLRSSSTSRRDNTILYIQRTGPPLNSQPALVPSPTYHPKGTTIPLGLIASFSMTQRPIVDPRNLLHFAPDTDTDLNTLHLVTNMPMASLNEQSAL